MVSRIISLALVVLILLLWIFNTPSHEQKGGIAPLFYKLIPMVVYLCSAILIFPDKTLSLLEKLILFVVVPFFSLLVSVVYLMTWFIEIRYSDKTWVLWEDDERIIANSFFYGVLFLLIIGMVFLYKKMRLRFPVSTSK